MPRRLLRVPLRALARLTSRQHFCLGADEPGPYTTFTNLRQQRMRHSPDLTIGIKVIIGFHIVSFVLWFFGQTLAVFAYDLVAGWGLQDPRSLVDPVIVEINRAIGLTDTILMLPLHALAAVGLLQRRFYGAVASWLVFGITLYWPVIFWTSQGFYAAANITHMPMTVAYVLLPGVAALFACWGSWYLYDNRGLLQ